MTISNILFAVYGSCRISSLQRCLCQLVSFSCFVSFSLLASLFLFIFCEPSEPLHRGTAAQSSSVRTKSSATDSDLSPINRLPGKDAFHSSRQGSLFWFPSSWTPLQTCHSSDFNWIHRCSFILVCQNGPGRHLQASLLWDTFLMLPPKPCPNFVAEAPCPGHLQHSSRLWQALPCPSSAHHSKHLGLHLRAPCDHTGTLNQHA